MRYRIPPSQTTVIVDISGGFPDGPENIDFSLEFSNALMWGSLGTPTVVPSPPPPGVAGVRATLTVETEDLEECTVTYRATDRTTGKLVAFTSDEFVIGGECEDLGLLSSEIPIESE